MKMVNKVFHTGKYFLTFNRGYEDRKKDVTITISKIFETNNLTICLSDEDEPSFLYVLNVSRNDYEDLKRQQGLLIDFDNFPSQLVKLLQHCAANNMFLILKQENPALCFFEIVEHNEFKKLVHLSLRTSPATDEEVKKHMSDTIHNLKKVIKCLKSSASSNENMWNDKFVNMERKIHELTFSISKLEEEKLRKESEFKEILRIESEKVMQEKQQFQRHIESINKTQLDTAYEKLDHKEKQIEELHTHLKQIQDNRQQLENHISEKSQRLTLLESEIQKSHIEVATLKAKNASLERDIAEKEKQYNSLNSKFNYLEKYVKDNADTIRDLTNKLQDTKREKANIEERLTTSESLVQKNNEALHTTSEQLIKANQIISKQNADIVEMKEKLLCRTAIVLEQEKVIEKNSKEIEDLRAENASTQKCMEKLKSDLEELKQKYDINEKALKDREETIKNNNMVIQWLHNKNEKHDVENKMKSDRSGKSPAYVFEEQNANLSSQSEESLDFYATSKLSSTIESCKKSKESCSSKLDPKYLKPSDDNRTKGTSNHHYTETRMLKGKENKTVHLPKVDYRENKSSKGSTFRPTPVSAYFP